MKIFSSDMKKMSFSIANSQFYLYRTQFNLSFDDGDKMSFYWGLTTLQFYLKSSALEKYEKYDTQVPGHISNIRNAFTFLDKKYSRFDHTEISIKFEYIKDNIAKKYLSDIEEFESKYNSLSGHSEEK